MVESAAATSPVISRDQAAVRQRARTGFFLAMSIVMLGVVFLGFAPTLFLRAFFDRADIPRYLYLHGGILTAWFAWLIVQASCVAAKRVDLHRRLGILGIALGVPAVVVSAMTTLRFGPRLAENGVDVEARLHFLSEIVWNNLCFLIFFCVFLSTAIIQRHRPQVHKRLMLLASISFLPPAISRIIDWPVWGVGNNAMLPLFACLVAFIVALGVHDLMSSKSVHPVTLVGGTAFAVCFAVTSFVIPNMEVGQSFVFALYNFMR
jgi:hypothetical protein